MTDNPKVSVLVTYYNDVEYVDQGIESILKQKCDFQFEIIVGDDGSNDGTREKLQDWCNQYPEKISLHVMNRDEKGKYLGPIRASRNRLNLLQYVKGEYFAYLDGDDYYIDDNKLQKQVDILDSHPEYNACGHKVLLYNETTTEKSYLPNCDKTYLRSVKAYWKRDYIHTDTLLFRTKDIKKLDEELLRDEFNDSLMTYALLKDGCVCYLPDAMAVYRQTGNGIYTGSDERIKYLREIISLDLEIKINPQLWRVARMRHSSHLRYFCRYTYKENKNEDSLKLWEKVIIDNQLELAMDSYKVICGDSPSKRLRKYALCAELDKSVDFVLHFPILLYRKVNRMLRM